jgi:hypothetical protein
MENSIIEKIKLIDADGSAVETIYAEKINTNSFMLLENPIFSCKLNYGAVIQAIPKKDGTLCMTKILKASSFKTRKFLLSETLSPPESENRFKQIIDAGGLWETAMGGLLFIHLPKDSSFDLNKFFADINFTPAEIIEDK